MEGEACGENCGPRNTVFDIDQDPRSAGIVSFHVYLLCPFPEHRVLSFTLFAESAAAVAIKKEENKTILIVYATGVTFCGKAIGIAGILYNDHTVNCSGSRIYSLSVLRNS